MTLTCLFLDWETNSVNSFSFVSYKIVIVIIMIFRENLFRNVNENKGL